jgi:hypothetical protein
MILGTWVGYVALLCYSCPCIRRCCASRYSEFCLTCFVHQGHPYEFNQSSWPTMYISMVLAASLTGGAALRRAYKVSCSRHGKISVCSPCSAVSSSYPLSFWGPRPSSRVAAALSPGTPAFRPKQNGMPSTAPLAVASWRSSPPPRPARCCSALRSNGLAPSFATRFLVR